LSGDSLVLSRMMSKAPYRIDSAVLFLPSRMTQFKNFETSLLSYLGSDTTGRSGTSLRLGMLAPQLIMVIGYWLLVTGYLCFRNE